MAEDRLSYQELAGAAERLAVRHGDRRRLDWVAAIESLRDRLSAPVFTPLAVFTREIEGRRGAKSRVVSSLRIPDAILAEALVHRLQPPVEALLSNAVHGYRRGRNTRTAALALQAALRAGQASLLLTDVESFFPSVDLKLLRQDLETLLPAPLVALVMALLDPPLEQPDGSWKAGRGLPLGNALSPLLSNLYLAPVDRAMAEWPGQYLRYGDDLLLACGDANTRARGQLILTRALQERRLRDSSAKRRYVNGTLPVRYLGLMVDAEGLYEPVPDPKPPVTRAPAEFEPLGDPSGRERVVYVTDSGLWLRIEHRRLQARRGKEILREIPMHRIDRIVIFGHCGLSSGFVAGCVRERIQVLFVVQRGRAFGSLVTEGLANPLRLRSQYSLLADPKRRRGLAVDVLKSKLEAMSLRLRGQAEHREELGEIDAIRGRLDAIEPPGEGRELTADLMGHEGAATAAYYRAFARRVLIPEFAFLKRTKQPPRDPINSLLSFTYSLLYGEMQATLLAHGLDPMPAVLHELGRAHAALASDLIEPYRSLLGDTFVLTLINQRQVKPDGFETNAKGAVLMTRETRRTVLEAYERMMRRPLGARPGATSARRLLHAAARAFLHVVLGETASLTLPLRASDVESDDSIEIIGEELLGGTAPAMAVA